MAAWQDPASIDKILRQYERRIRDLFLIAIDEYLDEMTTSKIMDLLSSGQIRQALEKATQVAAATANASQGAFLAAAEATAAYIQAGSIMTVGFDQTNARALHILQKNKLEFIQGFTDQQFRATNRALVDGMRDGVGPRTMARNFRQSIGLTEKQYQAVDNYRKLLQRIGWEDVPKRDQREALSRALRDKRHDRRILRSIRGEEKIPAAQIEKMVARYHQNSIKRRAETIARTEALSGVHGGQEAAMDDAIGNGAVDRQDIIQKWNTAMDGRQRDAHAELHGTSVPWGDPWVNEIGPIHYPGDRSADVGNIINCRCVRTIRLK